MLENEYYVKIIAYLLGTVVAFLTVISGIVAWIFKEHINDNNFQFAKNDRIHERLFDKIDCKEDKE